MNRKNIEDRGKSTATTTSPVSSVNPEDFVCQGIQVEKDEGSKPKEARRKVRGTQENTRDVHIFSSF